MHLRRRRGCSSHRRPATPGRHHPNRPFARMTAEHLSARRLLRDPRPTPTPSRRCPISRTSRNRLSADSARRCTPEPSRPIPKPTGPRRRDSVPRFRHPRIPPRPRGRPAPDRIISVRISSVPPSSTCRRRRPVCHRSTPTPVSRRPVHLCPLPPAPILLPIRDRLSGRSRRPRSPVTNLHRTRVPHRWGPAPRRTTLGRNTLGSHSPGSRCSTDTGRRREARRSTRSR